MGEVNQGETIEDQYNTTKINGPVGTKSYFCFLFIFFNPQWIPVSEHNRFSWYPSIESYGHQSLSFFAGRATTDIQRRTTSVLCAFSELWAMKWPLFDAVEILQRWSSQVLHFRCLPVILRNTYPIAPKTKNMFYSQQQQRYCPVQRKIILGFLPDFVFCSVLVCASLCC